MARKYPTEWWSALERNKPHLNEVFIYGGVQMLTRG
jgi:hypothetical protein